ncbi:putative afln vera monooxygenase protein [Botrytis fragariae]|uniref:Putative afln vera monooxygenase protein n=1 Tax=Botrytis fragariae TaxID=1964551 RepID=A0A8H6AWK2_9HELO|nr:putative afln vera monooxygenase protein [Botrytis fragariae]KAF5874720.1 putative afln vera monooxygenase protein [Botrytis fragariae]
MTIFVMKLYQVRSFIRGLQKQGLARSHSPSDGQRPIMSIKTSTNQSPSLCPLIIGYSDTYLPVQVSLAVSLHTPMASMLETKSDKDIPIAAPILVVLKPDMMYQLTQANQIPKDKGIRAFLKPLTGESDLVTLEGNTWKHWRAIFNPGFSAGHGSSLVPSMIEEIKIFKDLLRKHAESGKMMFLEDASLSLTIDIIGKNSYRMNRYLSQELDKCYRSIKGTEIRKKDKLIVDLALRAYLAENPSATGIDKSFQNFAMAQIKLFIFAGHATTSAGAIFTYHLFSQHPNVLAKVRDEHTEVLGANIADAESVITSKPQILNQLTYTIAAMKESLRIYPTVAALRDGQSYFSLIGDNGLRFPTERTIVWGDHYTTHHNPAHWARA